jgi:adenosylcobinamide kinase/adenosylcobinamide-phosphate guanylyltransferase
MDQNAKILVIGGAASGKSNYAESLIFATERPRVYLATAQAFDSEMRDKVKAHQNARGPNWTTIEEPIAIADVVRSLSHDDILLIDCLTLWITNLVLGEHNIEEANKDLIAALREAACPVVLVSNEVGQGIVPDNALSRKFRAAQGRLNQQIAAECDHVVTVIAGLTLNLKGTILS